MKTEAEKEAKSLIAIWKEFASPEKRIQLTCIECSEQHIKIPFNCSCKCHTLEFLLMIKQDLEKLFERLLIESDWDVDYVETIKFVRSKILGEEK